VRRLDDARILADGVDHDSAEQVVLAWLLEEAAGRGDER
jgi:hypothetical protein